MKHPISIFQKLLDSDVKTELAMLYLLQQYNHYLHAIPYKETPAPFSISRMLLYLSAIQKFHFEKIRIYQALSPQDVRKCVSRELLIEQEKIKNRVEMTLESMKDLIPPHFNRMNMDDLVEMISRKKHFLSSMLAVPAAPWISPDVKKR